MAHIAEKTIYSWQHGYLRPLISIMMQEVTTLDMTNEDGLFNLPPYERGRLAIDWSKQKGGKTKLAACQQETTLAADDWTRLVWMTETSPFHNKKKSIASRHLRKQNKKHVKPIVLIS